jgi:hypothetical protein
MVIKEVGEKNKERNQQHREITSSNFFSKWMCKLICFHAVAEPEKKKTLGGR